MDALEKSASVLLQQNTITIQYIDKLKQLYHEPALHITLFGNIILPHAEPQNGVRQMSMSLLHIRRGIRVQNGKKVYFVVTLAAVDKTSHFNALRQLCRIAQSQSCIERMKSAESNVALSQVIKEFLGAVKEPALE
jgi:mannitol/fructose-specific phosphotransferase system IIA component (Ntr-type)